MTDNFYDYSFFQIMTEPRHPNCSIALYQKPVRRTFRKSKPYTIIFKDFSLFSLGTMIVQPKKLKHKRKLNYQPTRPAVLKELDNFLHKKSQDFFILPKSSQNENQFPLLQTILNCVTYQQYFLNSWSEKFYTPFSVWYSDEFRQTLVSCVKENLRIKFLLRKFLQFWRLKHLKQVNTEDIVTLEFPLEPIYIINWEQRQKYVFEKTTLLQDIQTKLKYCSGFFDQPLMPRNPLTNLPLTISQMISVWNQLQPIPQKYMIVSLFQNYNFNMYNFKTDQKILLRLNALHKTMAQNCYDSNERLLDFISLAFQIKNIPCFLDKFTKLLNESPEHEYLQRWKHLCIRYYEADIRYEENYEKKRDIQDHIIWNMTRFLIYKQSHVLI